MPDKRAAAHTGGADPCRFGRLFFEPLAAAVVAHHPSWLALRPLSPGAACLDGANVSGEAITQPAAHTGQDEHDYTPLSTLAALFILFGWGGSH